MCSKCESCGTLASASVRIYYVEDWDKCLCGTCEVELEDGMEEHEERKRRRIAADNEY